MHYKTQRAEFICIERGVRCVDNMTYREVSSSDLIQVTVRRDEENSFEIIANLVSLSK